MPKPEKTQLRIVPKSDTGVNFRFYIDPATGLPHIYNHHVNEDEVEQALENRGEDRPGSKNSRIAIGQTEAGSICG
jgi:hypothetical protein